MTVGSDQPDGVDEETGVFADRLWVAAGGLPTTGMTFSGVTLGYMDRINELERLLSYAFVQIAHLNEVVFPRKENDGH